MNPGNVKAKIRLREVRRQEKVERLGNGWERKSYLYTVREPEQEQRSQYHNATQKQGKGKKQSEVKCPKLDKSGKHSTGVFSKVMEVILFDNTINKIVKTINRNS